MEENLELSIFHIQKYFLETSEEIEQKSLLITFKYNQYIANR